MYNACTIEGYLFDAYVEGGRIAVWIWSQGSVVKLHDTFQPALYVVQDRRLIAFLMARHVPMRQVTRKDFAEQKDILVLELLPGIARFYEIVRAIEDYGGYTYELYNADIPLEQRYFFEKGLFPFCKVRVTTQESGEQRQDGQRITTIGNIDDDHLDYDLPPFRVLTLAVGCAEDVRKGVHVPAQMITLNGRTIDARELEGGEAALLRQATALYSREDPDIILAEHGDLALPHLAHRLAFHGIPFRFGRDPDLFLGTSRVGKSYFSYGRILYKDRPAFLRGRLHVDASSFICREGGLDGCIELSRICRVPLQRMARQSPGSGISNLQVLHAYKDYLIPHKKGTPERYKTGHLLFLADKGGVILEPAVGFHENVAELDFVSMYPSIMVAKNISPETVGCTCCPPNTPGIGLAVCTKREGLIPRILAPLIARRAYCKAHPSERNKRRAAVLKWVLVTSFGYLGFRHARFGRIEAHEAINAHARQTLLAAMRTAEGQGFRVLHGIIDSLWVAKQGMTRDDVDSLARAVTDATGLAVGIEGIYRWAVFLPSVTHPTVPVPSRFYGLFADGTLKCRGIDLRRHDTPKIVADLQQEALGILSRAQTRQEFLDAAGRCVRLLQARAKELAVLARALQAETAMRASGELVHAASRAAVSSDFTIRKRISRLDYAVETAQKIITGRLAAEGLALRPGESISYVIRDNSAKRPSDRFSPAHDADAVDSDAYRGLMVCAIEGILLPFGYTRERLWRMIRNESQLSLFDCLLAWKPMLPSSLPAFERVQRCVGEFG